MAVTRLALRYRIMLALAKVSSVRNSVMGSPDFAAPTTNGRFHGCDAAPFSDRSGQSVCCWSEGRDFHSTASGSDRTDAVREENAISLVAE
jgi:hypothetical protein